MHQTTLYHTICMWKIFLFMNVDFWPFYFKLAYAPQLGVFLDAFAISFFISCVFLILATNNLDHSWETNRKKLKGLEWLEVTQAHSCFASNFIKLSGAIYFFHFVQWVWLICSHKLKWLAYILETSTLQSRLMTSYKIKWHFNYHCPLLCSLLVLAKTFIVTNCSSKGSQICIHEIHIM